MKLSLNDRRKVGSTTLALPPFGFGGGALGELYAPIEEAQSTATLNAAWDAGLRFYDTAPWYGRGLSENRVGNFLRPKPRADYILTTKVGRTLHRPKDPTTFDRSPWTGGLNFEVKFDYSRDGILHSYGQALQRLGIDTVDALLVHDLDAGFHGDATAGHQRDLEASGFAALEELKAAGDIRAIGMGVNNTQAFNEIASRVDVDFLIVAMPYTLLDQSSLASGMKRCAERNIGVIIGAPFSSGILVTGSGGGATYGYSAAPPAIQQKVRSIEAVCAAHGVALPAAALQFPLAHPAVVSIIPGMLSPEQVRQNIASVTSDIPSAFWSDLKTEGLIDPEAPTP